MSEALLAAAEYLLAEEAVGTIGTCGFQNNFVSKGMIEKCGFHFEQEGTFYSGSLGKEFSSYEYRINRKTK